MFKALFQLIMNMAGTIIQLVCYPINAVITSVLPDVSDKIQQVGQAIPTMFSGITWAVNILPTSVIVVLTFVITCEIAKHTIYIQTHTLIKVWNVLQKIKFW